MSLTKKEKSKIIIKHLEKDFEMKSKVGETYLIMSITDALNEIENLENETIENNHDNNNYSGYDGSFLNL